MKWLRRLLCQHERLHFVRNVYGDEITLLWCRSLWQCSSCGSLERRPQLHGGLRVACSQGTRLVAPGAKWRDMLTGSTWEVVEPSGQRMYSPSGLGGTMGFWCKPVGELEGLAKDWLRYARPDGCVEFCGDSVAAMLLDADQPEESLK